MVLLLTNVGWFLSWSSIRAFLSGRALMDQDGFSVRSCKNNFPLRLVPQFGWERLFCKKEYSELIHLFGHAATKATVRPCLF